MDRLSQSHNPRMALRNKKSEQCACKHGLTTTNLTVSFSIGLSSCSPSFLFPTNDLKRDSTFSHSRAHRTWCHTHQTLAHPTPGTTHPSALSCPLSLNHRTFYRHSEEKERGREKRRTFKSPLLFSWVK